MNARIPYTKPSITDLEIDYVNDAIRHGWGENCYDYIRKFESAFKNYLKVDFAVSTSSCTGALHMGLVALGIGPGDEVILADTNWIASAAPIMYLGAKPIFVDILEESWCLDPKKVEDAINPNTKAIIVVHLYGNLAEVDELIQIGRRFNIPIIEDSAEALGSFYKNHAAGTFGTFGVFSFHGTKTVTSGEGGMFVTNDKNLYEKVLTLSNHGRNPQEKRQFWPERIGFKYKMSNIQAALGCAQLERIDSLVNRKREIMKSYERYLKVLPTIKMNPEKESTKNSFWMPTIVFSQNSGLRSEELIGIFEKNGIDARTFFAPLSSLPFFNRETKNTNSYSIYHRALNLPSFHDINDKEIRLISKVILDFCKT